MDKGRIDSEQAFNYYDICDPITHLRSQGNIFNSDHMKTHKFEKWPFLFTKYHKIIPLSLVQRISFGNSANKTYNNGNVCDVLVLLINYYKDNLGHLPPRKIHTLYVFRRHFTPPWRYPTLKNVQSPVYLRAVKQNNNPPMTIYICVPDPGRQHNAK